MLTIKICFPDGMELVREVLSVMIRPAEEFRKRCVSYFPPGESWIDIFQGSVYVMNDNGKTVADYYLGSQE